jgi:hypothetical protein
MDRMKDTRPAVYAEHADRLEELGLMLGEDRGRLALGLDLLTEALVAAGSHSVYCRQKGDVARPSRDMQAIAARIEQAKHLIQDVMGSLATRPA